MVLGIGVDLMDVARMEDEARKGGADFLASLFTPGEIAYCAEKRHPAQHYAARFAAKEALFKALGIERARGLCWREVEVANDAEGRPALLLHDSVKETAARRRVDRIHVSLSHTGEVAIAQVVLEDHTQVKST